MSYSEYINETAVSLKHTNRTCQSAWWPLHKNIVHTASVHYWRHIFMDITTLCIAQVLLPLPLTHNQIPYEVLFRFTLGMHVNYRLSKLLMGLLSL